MIFLFFNQVLECFELQPDNNVFLELIPIFPKVGINGSPDQFYAWHVELNSKLLCSHDFVFFIQSHASQILGFKFQYYQRMEVNSPAPFGLYKLTALLVKAEFIDLDSM